ncbi:MAG TPA: zinc metallopeptidase [Candidatus Limnocylindria bacterium]|nr:zinc metallopeptidase [Candidatus Limnocylindria bacterium]
MGGFLPYILLVMLPSIAITGWAAWRVRSTYAKWSKVDSGIRLSAFDFARQLLDRQGLRDVRIEPVEGQLTDHYDPRGKVLRVSSTVSGQPQLGNYDPQAQTLGVPVPANGLSVAAAAVIAHEVGHALQDRERDPWMAVRQAIVPAVQLGSGVGPWLIIGGLIFNLLSLSWLGLIFFAAAVVFTFVTLPVEIGASGKALAFVSNLGMMGEQQTGARDVLKAAAWTYVAAALTALLTFLYYLMLIAGRRD